MNRKGLLFTFGAGAERVRHRRIVHTAAQPVAGTSPSDAIKRLGEKPPVFSRDFKGFLIEGFTAARSVTGTPGALKAMRGNEHLTNRSYKNALSWDLPQDVRTIIEANYEDERRHLSYIDDAIMKRVWESGAEATTET